MIMRIRTGTPIHTDRFRRPDRADRHDLSGGNGWPQDQMGSRVGPELAGVGRLKKKLEKKT